MDAQFVTQMDGEQHARVRRLLTPAFSSRRIEQLQESITGIVDGMLDRIEANGPAFDGMKDYGALLVVEGAPQFRAPLTLSQASRGPRNCGAPSTAPWKRSRRSSMSGAPARARTSLVISSMPVMPA